MHNAMEYDLLVDLRGLCCAQPILRLTKELKNLQAGKVLLAVSDKTSMRHDIRAYCDQTHHPLVHHDEHEGLLRFWIKKAGSPISS